jgi:hypothetical protein
MPPLKQDDALKLIKRKHPEWSESQKRWRFLQDSLEGGNRYRYANYVSDPLSDDPGGAWYQNTLSGSSNSGINNAIDPTTGVVRRLFYGVVAECNLVPHVSETTAGGAEVYAMRLERTPVPTIVQRSIRKHMSRIFSHEVKREGPAAIKAWWENVDGCSQPTKIDKYVRKTIGPLLLVLGQLDILCDHPAAPAGAAIESRADSNKYRLNDCVVSYILPENMLWWELDPVSRSYVECLVFERTRHGPIFRHWTPTESNAYNSEGKAVLSLSRVHPFQAVPIVRVFDDRKPRCENTGQSRYESVAELQKEIYNKKSELILGDILQSHPVLQGPEEYVSEGGQVAIGPSNVLPKKHDTSKGGYEGWGYVDPPKGAQAEVRSHIQDDLDEADREACLLKPAGATTSGTVSQSGVSKVMDHDEGNDYLSELAETLADAERTIACNALRVLSNGEPSPGDVAAITVEYPKEFDLYSLDDLMAFLTELQGVTSAGGNLPLTEAEACKRAIRISFSGASDEQIMLFENEIDDFFKAKAVEREQMAEMRPTLPDPGEGNAADVEDEQGQDDASAMLPGRGVINQGPA